MAKSHVNYNFEFLRLVLNWFHSLLARTGFQERMMNLLAGDSVYFWLLRHEPSKGRVSVYKLLSLTAGLGCLSKNLPLPLCSDAENPRWAFSPRPSWLLILVIYFVNILNAKVHDWSKRSCVIVLCHKWSHWHSVGLVPKWNHPFDPKSSGYFFGQQKYERDSIWQRLEMLWNPLPIHFCSISVPSLVCC